MRQTFRNPVDQSAVELYERGSTACVERKVQSHDVLMPFSAEL